MKRIGLDQYDDRPKDMIQYLRYNGLHFNKKMCDFAIEKMTKIVNGKEEQIQPISKDYLDQLMKQHNIKLKNNVLYDYVFVANMCKADYYGSSIEDELHLALYVKDTVDDIDQSDGFIFNRWYADMVRSGIPIDWENMV